MNASTPAEFRRIPGHPLFGHLRDFKHDRVGVQLKIAREAPDGARVRFGLLDSTVVGSPSLAQEVLVTQHEAFVKSPALTMFLRPILGLGLLTSEGEFHAKQRKLLAGAFAHKRIAAYAGTMVERSERAAQALRDGEVVDVAEHMMRLTLEIVGKTLFDAEVGEDASEVGDALTLAMESVLAQLGSLVPVPPFVPTPTNLRIRRATARLDAVLYRIIRERRALGGDRGDVLSVLLSAKDDDGVAMSDKQIRDEAMTLFLAGHETTANALSWTLYLLAKHPEARECVERELDALGRSPTYEDLKLLPYTLASLKEAMRLYPPAYVLSRRATRPVTLQGHRLARHSIVFINVIGLHRRPDLYPEPERFRPERFLGDAEKALPRCAYLPFGAGPRVCIGNHFASMEGHLLLATLLRQRSFSLVSDVPVEPEPLITLRPRGGLRMRVSVRSVPTSASA